MSEPRTLPKPVVILALWAWLLLLTLTHLGARSPYSYGWAIFNEPSARMNGAVVNPDALPLRNVTMFFYEGESLDWPNAQNLRLPMHSFATSIVAGLTGSYLFASYAVNFLFAALVALAGVNAADRFGIRRGVTLVVLLTLFSLPMYVEYLGQPLHYVAGPAISFLVLLAMLALDERDARNPWIAGLATTLLTLNYDPYVFVAAVAAYVLFIGRFARARDYVVYVIAAALPNILWSQFLRLESRGTMTKHLRKTFIAPVIDGWMTFVRDPIDNILVPFVATHIGAHVALHQIVAMIHWPLVLLCVFLLIRLRPRLATRAWLFPLLVLFFVLEQMAASAWDWELNPRRAIPVVLAFAVAYCWSAERTWDVRGWRIAFIALLLLSAVLAMSDTLFGKPVLAFLHTGQAVRQQPQDGIRIEELTLDQRSMPKLMRDDPITWRDLGRARLANVRQFTIAQAFLLALLAGLFWLVARARLLPRWAPLAAVAVWALSFVRFF